ncbi:MAG TPA: glycosyltransferase family 39 protein, partial [Acidimicrobiales bacterium]
DKPPASMWLQALSVRIFGFSSWAMLVPEALCGVASVLILHRMVRRWAGDTAAHLAALALALTPVAVLMFRFNNPDALLTLLCLAAAWALWSALESGRTRWLVVSGALIGLAFDTKMLQAFVVLPAFIVVYLVAGKPKFLGRLGQLSAALAAVIVSSGWWIAIVALWPAADRPYIGSTTDNSIVSLLFGYNGLSRLFGNSGGGPGGGGGSPGGAGGAMSTGFGGAVGWLRMFNTANGGQIAWLIPLAVAGLLAGLWLTRRAPRTDLARAGWILWGLWAIACFVTFSRAQGVFHPYYSVQLAPPLAALAGAGGLALWRLGRTNRGLRWALPTAILATAALAVALLSLTPSYLPWLRPLIIGGAVAAVVGLWLGSHVRHKPLVLVAGAVAVATLLAGPAAFAYTTVHTSATGSIVFAGPTGSTSDFGGGAGPGAGGARTADAGLISYLQANQGDATYLVAAFGSQSSAPIIIATGQPVITIGGFSGGDPAPTLDQFKAMVAAGEVRFVLVGGNGGGPGANGSGSTISSWATANGSVVAADLYGGSSSGTLYDLSPAA